ASSTCWAWMTWSSCPNPAASPSTDSRRSLSSSATPDAWGVLEMGPFAITPAQERLREVARQFAGRVVAPAAADLDRRADPRECFSPAIVEEASKAGLRTLTLPPELGGQGADSLTAAIVMEELAKADLGVAVFFAQALKIGQTLHKACT